MRNRCFITSSIALAGVIAIVWLSPIFLAAQTPSAAPGRATAATSWTVPRTPDGQPDLQGYYTNPNFTPLERPAKFAGKEFFAPEEAEAFFKEAVERSYEFTFANSAETPVYDATVYGLDRWQIGARQNNRTSLIVDPPDGRVPPLTAEAEKRAADRAAVRNGRGAFDGPEDLPMGTRCMAGTPHMLGGGYRSQYHIVQSRTHVTIVYEDMHNVRIVALDGSAPLPQGLRRIMGDSRGRWEGDTLVVETTNIANKDNYMGSGPDLRVVERFTRVDAETLLYRFTASDPKTWTKPWTAEVPLMQIQGPVFEYACAEGNNGLVNILEGARAEEKASAKAAKTSSP